MSHSNNGRTVSPSKVKLHMPKMTIASSDKSKSSRSKSRDTDEEGSSGRGSIGKRIGAQFFVENTASIHNNRPSIKGFEGFEHLILSSGEEEDEDYKVPTNRVLGDSTYVSCSSLKTGIILEDNDIRTSRTDSGNGPDFATIRDQDSVPNGINVFEDTKEPTREKHQRFQSRLKKSTILNEQPVSSVEEDLSYVTEQLQIIQQTQDSILNSLRTDIEVVQAENTLLSSKNLQLQSQVSHLNQLVADLSMDLRHMRDVVRSKQALGVSLSLLHGKDPNYFTEEETKSMSIDYSSNQSTGNEASPAVILSHVHTQMHHPSHNHKRQRSQEHRNGTHRKDRDASRPGTATSKQIPLDSKATKHSMKAEKHSKKGLKEKKSVSSKKTLGTLNGNEPNAASAYVESSPSKPFKSPGCFSRLFGSKKSRRSRED